MMNKVRIDLDGGDYALVFEEMIHRTQRLIKEANSRALGMEKFRELQKALNNAKNPEEAKQIIEQAFAGIDNDSETEEIILLNQITEWSFGTVDKQTLEELPVTKYDKLLAEVNRLYTPRPFV